MNAARITAYALLLYGVSLHTYSQLVEAESFSIGWLLWSLAPYVVGSVFLLLGRPHATVGALVVPAFLDAANFYSVFIHPESSTASLGILFMPFWNLVVFVPIGAAIGWRVGRRSKLAAETTPPDTSLERTRGK